MNPDMSGADLEPHAKLRQARFIQSPVIAGLDPAIQ